MRPPPGPSSCGTTSILCRAPAEPMGRGIIGAANGRAGESFGPDARLTPLSGGRFPALMIPFRAIAFVRRPAVSRRLREPGRRRSIPFVRLAFFVPSPGKKSRKLKSRHNAAKSGLANIAQN
ncbi:MAG: hypothetical protein V3571_13850 [Pseudodesulfovibrio sp.]